jgi:hypothetical protein
MKLHTKALMSSAALVMLAAGLVTTFAPQELLAHYGGAAAAVPVLVVQATGALFLGFAMLNWMAKDNLIGGIYSRPVAMGNFVHFFVLAAALVKAVAGGHTQTAILAATAVYVVFTVWFGLVAFTSPLPKDA